MEPRVSARASLLLREDDEGIEACGPSPTSVVGRLRGWLFGGCSQCRATQEQELEALREPPTSTMSVEAHVFVILGWSRSEGVRKPGDPCRDGETAATGFALPTVR
ncbi:hypothetical protein FHS67_004603 [Aminobacter aminovorans]|uniref:Uncharacterized protein n=1 Tax=Aminobacter aminovorans TaxID=83263 RepID=A0ABR6HCL6_AMIAI|nr:hypothetical protein [Aminobacter aminovorans]